MEVINQTSPSEFGIGYFIIPLLLTALIVSIAFYIEKRRNKRW
jgi:hypothetical protein